MGEPRADTIAALATAPGIGAIAIIRVSGPEAVALAGRVVQTKRGLAGAKGYTVHHGYAVDAEGGRIDEVLATVFRAPHSYTGEDLVEIGCHGGLVAPGLVLEALIGAGVRQAEPGEFSRRAYMNGRMDLSQAEGVMGMIAAQSIRANRVAMEQIEGRLGRKVAGLRASLLSLCALLELDLDFAEEGLTVVAPEEMVRKIVALKDEVSVLASTYREGRLMREGAGVALVGLPNAGKSSLFNALVRESRAIVSPHPGTTRDVIEECVVLNGMLFRLHDTAGIRMATDEAEREGVKRSLDAISRDDIVMLVVDSSDIPSEEELKQIRQGMRVGQALLWVLSKSDIRPDGEGMITTLRCDGERAVCVSAITGEGLKALESALVDVLSPVAHGGETVVVTQQRQYRALADAAGRLDQAVVAVQDGFSNEAIAIDVRDAADLLGEITGEIRREDVLNAIFAEFCIGK